MKILHVVRQFYPAIGGLENYVYNLASEQVRMGNQVKVLTLNSNYITGEVYPNMETLNNGIRIIRIPFRFSKKYPLALGALKYLKQDFDVVNIHAVDFFADFTSFTRFLHKKKLVLTTHGGFFHSSWGSLLKKFFFHTITRFSLRNYDAVIGCSENDVTVFNKITNKIQLIHNGVNIQPYLNTPKSMVQGELLYIGRVDKHKRVDRLIELTHYLIKGGNNVHLRVVGPDWANLTPELLKLAQSLGITDHIKLEGAVSFDQLKEFYSRANVFLSASKYEGFGLSAVEAMSSGTLCVLNNIESFANLARDKEFAHVSDFENKELTAGLIEDFLKLSPDLYNTYSTKAREFSKTFDWEKVAIKFDSVYRAIIQ